MGENKTKLMPGLRYHLRIFSQNDPRDNTGPLPLLFFSPAKLDDKMHY